MALPPEPGRLQTNALVNVARSARGCRTRGDDRLETRAYAVKRLLWRWGHAERSGHYARSIWQLVDGLAPIMGWGPVPARDDPRRRRWLRAHAANVRRWLDDLQAAGIISYTGETDNLGMDWRTLITLHQVPAPPLEQLRAAQRRMATWARRRRAAAARRRRRRARGRGRSLEAIRRSSQTPGAAARRRLAIARGLATRERRGPAAVEMQLDGRELSKLRTHHRGSSNCVGATSTAISTNHVEGSNACGARTGVCARQDQPNDVGVTRHPPTGPATVDAAVSAVAATASPRIGGTGPVFASKGVVPWDESALQERVAAHLAARQSVWDLIAAQAAGRAAEVAGWTLDRGWPVGRMREAWVVWRFGSLCAGELGAAPAGRLEGDDLVRLRRALGRYERYATARPPGFPAGGLAVLAAVAAIAAERDARPLRLRFAIRVLDQLSRRMRAAATVNDPRRRDRAAARARRRHTSPRAGGAMFAFRTAAWPGWVALDDDGDPLLDGDELVLVQRPGIQAAPDGDDPSYLRTLRDAQLISRLWPRANADGRTLMAEHDSTYDLDAERRRARPGPYAPPTDRRELAWLGGMSLAAAAGEPRRVDAPTHHPECPCAACSSTSPAPLSSVARSRGELERDWVAICGELRRVVPDTTFEIWLAPLSARSVVDRTLVIGAPNEIRSWVADHFARVLQACAATVLGDGVRIGVVTMDTRC